MKKPFLSRPFFTCSFYFEGDGRTRWTWPHEYTYFLMHKDNIDTMQAVASIAPLLNGARATAITYAGTKDKRGKTTQWLCIRRREPSLIKRAMQRLRNIHAGNFMFRDQPLKLGQLQGNRYVKTIRASRAIILFDNYVLSDFVLHCVK